MTKTLKREINYVHEDDSTTKEIVEVRKLPFGERNTVMDECLQIGAVGSAVRLNVSMKTLQEHAMALAVMKAPWKLNDLETIRQLDADNAEEVWNMVEELNNFNFTKKLISVEPTTANAQSTEQKNEP